MVLRLVRQSVQQEVEFRNRVRAVRALASDCSGQYIPRKLKHDGVSVGDADLGGGPVGAQI